MTWIPGSLGEGADAFRSATGSKDQQQHLCGLRADCITAAAHLLTTAQRRAH